MEKVTASISEVMSSINVQNATAVYYKGSESRAEGDGGYFKLDINGNEVKLEFADENGKTRNIPIMGVVNASPRYMFFFPDSYALFQVLCDNYINNDALSAEGTNQVVEACRIVCIADRTTGKIYRIPQINLKNGDKGLECNGKYYLAGNSEGWEWLNDNYFNQIYAFDPNSLTVTGILPENQMFDEFTINTDGFIGYFSYYSEPAKAKCPGGGLKLLSDGAIYTLNNTFYTADTQDHVMYRWEANGSNNMTSTAVCALPESFDYAYYLYNNQKNLYVFAGWDENGYCTYKFDGNEISKNDVTIPDQFFYSGREERYESSEAWYHLNSSKTKLTKLSKADYSNTTVNISDYQIVELVSNPDVADLSFTGIRYTDTKKVIGKILANNTIVITSAQTSAQNIYNLIPLN